MTTLLKCEDWRCPVLMNKYYDLHIFLELLRLSRYDYDSNSAWECFWNTTKSNRDLGDLEDYVENGNWDFISIFFQDFHRIKATCATKVCKNSFFNNLIYQVNASTISLSMARKRFVYLNWFCGPDGISPQDLINFWLLEIPRLGFSSLLCKMEWLHIREPK